MSVKFVDGDRLTFKSVRFFQITAADSDNVFALDSQGALWRYLVSQEQWVKIVSPKVVPIDYEFIVPKGQPL